MKSYYLLIVGALLLSFSSCQQKEKPSNAENDIIGVYQYLGNLEGLSVITENHFLFTGRVKDGSSAADTTVPYKNEYQSLIVEGGTYTREDTIVTCTLLFDKDPSNTGNTFRFSYSFRGDTFYYHVLNDNDEVVGSGSCLKLKQSDAQNSSMGVYRYLGPAREGMAVMTADYFIYAFRSIHEPLPVDSKDYYKNEYQRLHIETGKYTQQDTIVSLYMFDENNKIASLDSPSLRFSFTFLGDTAHFVILNDQGKPRGGGMLSLRIE